MDTDQPPSLEERVQQLEYEVKLLRDTDARAQMYADQAAAWAIKCQRLYDQLNKPNSYPGEAISGGGPNP